MENISVCVLTGYKSKNIKFIKGANPLIIEYEFRPVGRVRIALPTYRSFRNSNDLKHPVLAGICRNAFEDQEEPPVIDTNFITTGIRAHTIPTTVRDKAYHLLRFLYFHGGRDYQPFDLTSDLDYPLCYSETPDEFDGVIRFLRDRDLIYYESIDTWVQSDILTFT